MPIQVAVPKETLPGEQRVALVPDLVQRFVKLGITVMIERGAGLASHFPDTAYPPEVIWVNTDQLATQLYAQADVVLKVQPPTEAEIAQLKPGAIVIGFMAPHRYPERVRLMQERQITSFAMELVPRISRAQSMDALSSQAAVAGYKAVLIAANLSGRFYPMLTTAAGTIRPSKVLVLGAGVAGLQAIATAKRLGAMVEAYDVRAAVKEQVQSLGATFINTGVTAEGSGGYARELTAEEKQQSQAVLEQHLLKADAIITTAAIPGRTAPVLISAAIVQQMKPGTVIFDLAAESGGNCELTQAGKTIEVGGVVIAGPENVPSLLAVHASEMYAKNLLNFFSPLVQAGALSLDWNDEIVKGSALTHDGKIVHEPTRQRIEG